jgi:signal transduction histidine kinase
LWVAGWDIGITRLDTATRRMTTFRHDPKDPRSLPTDQVLLLHALPGGKILVGTQHGTAILDEDRRRFRPLSDWNRAAGNGRVSAAANDDAGGVWLCANRITFPGDATVLHVGPSGTAESHGATTAGLGPCYAVHVDRRQNVWVGSQGAVYVLPAGTGRFRRQPLPLEVSYNDATNILEDDGGNIWVSAGPRLLRIADAVRLPEKPRVDSFDGRDGFYGPVPMGAAFRTRRGEMFFGGVGGLTSFWPQRFRDRSTAPRVILTDIKVLNRPLRPCLPGSPLQTSVPGAEALTLGPDASMITFGFAALDFRRPQKNEYSYRLDGFDRQWNDAGERHEATYTNLSPGRYTFRVRAVAPDGGPAAPETSMRLTLLPPFWGTWWFRAAILLGITGWAWSLHRHRVRLLMMQNREVAARMEERSRLARDLHDTLEQALAGVRLQLSVAADNLEEAPAAVASNLDLARRMLAYCSEEARRAVMELRSTSLEQGNLGLALSEQAGRLTRGTTFSADVRTTGEPRRLGPAIEHHLFRIAQEATTNAIKHSGGNRIVIELAYEPTGTTLVVRDNGRGLAGEPPPDGHFGLRGMRERAERLGAVLAVSSPPSGGVEIRVRVDASVEGAPSPSM